MIPDRFGKYRVLRRIASGGMAEVYLCRLSGEEGFRKRVALKVVHSRHAEDPLFRELFVREARLAAALSHPNLVQVFDFGREGDEYFLAMEYIEGWNLAQVAAQARQFDLPISPGAWRHWVDGIWSGLAYLHEKGVVHRDVSPTNILVARNGAVKITDFGISLAAGDGGWTDGTRAGKTGYLAPERVRGERATSSSDLFAAGVISVELLLGRRLFEGDRPEAVLERIRRFDAGTLAVPGVSPEVAAALRKSVAASPSDRYATAGEFLTALAQVGPSPATAPERTDFWDALFPGAQEEETAPDSAMEPEARPAMLKERGERYGARGRTIQQAGAAAMFAAVVVGGVLLWKEAGRRSVTTEAAPVPAASAAHAVSTPAPESSSALRSYPAAPAVSKASMERGPSRPESPRATLARTSGSSASSDPPAARLVMVETDPPGAAVLLESGASVGKTPLQLDLSSIAGRKIVLSMDGYERQSVPADALAAGPAYRAGLQPILGTVEAIQAIPWAKVHLGNRLLGETPLTGVRLPVGEHRLRLVNEPLGVEQVVTVVVRPGANPKIIVPLTGAGRR